MNKKGFTLIELLAVITIMGILMIVAVPAITRTIENSRKDVFADTARKYVSAVKNFWAAGSLECMEVAGDSNSYTSVGALPDGEYYIDIETYVKGIGGYDNVILLEEGEYSPWGKARLTGYVKIVVDSEGEDKGNKYYVALVDYKRHGIYEEIAEEDIKRSSVSTNVRYPAYPRTKYEPSKYKDKMCREI